MVARATLLAACVAAASGRRAGNTLMPQAEGDKTATLVQFTDPAAEAVKALTKASAQSGQEDPASGLQLKNLRGMLGKDAMDAIYTDPREMEKHMRAVDPRLNASLVKGNTKDPAAFKKWCEEEFKTGSRVTDYSKFEYDGPTSNRSVVFNLGSYKTGSTSVDVAVKKLGMKSCKVGWNGAAGSKAAFDGNHIHEYQKCAVNTPDAKCPGREADPVRDAQFTCDVLGDAPWPFAWPTAMRAFPNAKFILSRQKTCKDWVYHVRGLWNAGSGQSTSATCWFDGGKGATGQRGPDYWHDRCVETERAIVLTAQKLGLPLLVLHATGPREGGKMEDLAKFLGKEVPKRAAAPDGVMQFPHVKTPSAHWEKSDVSPPEDELDPNEDLWGDWNGGVPTGNHKWAKDLKLACAKPPCAKVSAKKPEETSTASGEKICPKPDGWCSHGGATNEPKECGGQPGHWCTDTFGKAGFAACDKKIERTWGAVKTWGKTEPVTCEEATGGVKKLKVTHDELIPTSTSTKKSSAEKAAELSEDELCPGHPHVLRSSASCLTRFEEPVRNTKRLAAKKQEPDDADDEPEWLRRYKQPASAIKQ
jgi:hypothetical protein